MSQELIMLKFQLLPVEVYGAVRVKHDKGVVVYV